MGLQLRVRHALGARLIEVAERSPDNPLRIGRDAECEVRIPSSSVAPVHCLLYVQDGQWVVQHIGDDTGTFVNGQPVAEAAYVAPGDAVTLGAGAATIELDPLGTMRKAMAAASASLRPPTPGAAAAASSGGLPAATAFAHEQPSSGSAQPYEVQSDEPADEYAQAGVEHAAAGTGEYAAGAWQASSPAYYQPVAVRYPVVRSRHNTTAAAITIGLLVVLAAAVAVFLANRQRPQPQPSGGELVLPDEPAAQYPKGYKPNIFDDMNRPQPPRRPAPAPQAPRVQNPGPVAPPAPAARSDTPETPQTPSIDPRKLTDDWKRVEESRIGKDYGKTIWNIEDYRKLHPGQFEDELRQFAQEALDLLWWARVKELCERRDRAQAEIEDLNRKIAEETDQEYKQGLIKDRKRKEDEKAAIIEMLTVDMGYTSNVIPNDQDDAQLAVLRRQRDEAKFRKWSERVVKYARDHNGDLPWQRTR